MSDREFNDDLSKRKEKVKVESSRKKDLFDKLPLMDKRRATKFIIYGLVIAVIFGTVLMTSKSVSANADNWAALADQENKQNFWDGEYGYQEYLERSKEIDRTQLWMKYQVVVFGNLARIAINIGLIFVFIGFIGFATNDNIDERTRRIALILAFVVLFMVMVTTFYTNITLMTS